MIVGIVGSRFRDGSIMSAKCAKIIRFAVSLLGPMDVVMSGGATGADWWAREEAIKAHRRYVEAPPNGLLGIHGLFARNRTIVMVSDKILAVWDGKSRGTKNTIDVAQELGKPLWVVLV